MVDVDTSLIDKYLERKSIELETKMIEECKDQMRLGIADHIDTGETINSIRSLQSGTNGDIMVSGAAVWLEFGTGVAKNSANHPMQAEAGMSAIGTYGEGQGSNPNGWNFPTKDGQWRHTKGIAQTRFMYNAGQYIKNNILSIAKGVFK